jgi:hemerythrin-like domain-containing protein
MFTITSKIGQLLHQDHVQAISLLQKLEEFLIGQTSKRPPDTSNETIAALLKNVATIIDDEITRHFGFEETYLFPALAEAGETGMTAFLAQEHGMIRPVAQELGGLAREAIKSGFTPENWKQFHSLGLEMVEREIFHIQKEEMGLLSAIAALIDPATDGELAMKFAEAR